MAGGTIFVEARLLRATFDNRHVEDLTEHVIEARASMDTGRDTTWVLDAKMTWGGWQKLRPYRDWLAPTLTVTYPSGIVRHGQLGLYMVLDAPENRGEIGRSVDIEARDPLWLLNAQRLPEKLKIPAGYKRTRLLRDILDSAVLTDPQGGGRPRYAIPNDETDFRRAKEWPADTRKLDLANEICPGVPFYPLWSGPQGVITTMHRGKDRLRDRAVVRTFRANVPGSVLFRPDARIVDTGLPGDVIGVVNTTPKSADLTNEVLIVSEDPYDRDDQGRGGHRRRRHELKDPKNRRHDPRRKRTRRERIPHLDNDATANQVARALMDELSVLNNTLSVTVVPDPQLDLARACVGMAVWDRHGDEVAFGKYAVLGASYGFTPSQAAMQLELGRVEDEDDFVRGQQ